MYPLEGVCDSCIPLPFCHAVVMVHGPTPEAGRCYWVSSGSWFNQSCGFFPGCRGTWDPLNEGSQADCWLLGFDWFCFAPHNGTKFMGRRVTERDWPYCPEDSNRKNEGLWFVVNRELAVIVVTSGFFSCPQAIRLGFFFHVLISNVLSPSLCLSHSQTDWKCTT